MEELRRRRKSLLSWVLVVAMMVGMVNSDVWLMHAKAGNLKITYQGIGSEVDYSNGAADADTVTLIGEVPDFPEGTTGDTVAYSYHWTDNDHVDVTPGTFAASNGIYICAGDYTVHVEAKLKSDYVAIRYPYGEGYTFTANGTNLTYGRDVTVNGNQYKEYYIQVDSNISASTIKSPLIQDSAGKAAVVQLPEVPDNYFQAGQTYNASYSEVWGTVVTFNPGENASFSDGSTQKVTIETDYYMSLPTPIKNVYGYKFVQWLYYASPGLESVPVAVKNPLNTTDSHTLNALWDSATMQLGLAKNGGFLDGTAYVSRHGMTSTETVYYSTAGLEEGSYAGMRIEIPANASTSEVGEGAYLITTEPKTEDELKMTLLSDWKYNSGCVVAFQEGVNYAYVTFVNPENEYDSSNGTYAYTSSNSLSASTKSGTPIIASGKVVVDNTAPTISYLVNGEKYTYDSSVESFYSLGAFKFKAEDTVSGIKQVTVDGTVVSTTDGYYTIAPSDEQMARVVVAEDNAGNKTTFTINVCGVKLTGSGAEYLTVDSITNGAYWLGGDPCPFSNLIITLKGAKDGYTLQSGRAIYINCEENAYENYETYDGIVGNSDDSKITFYWWNCYSMFQNGTLALCLNKNTHVDDGEYAKISMKVGDVEYAKETDTSKETTVYFKEAPTVSVSVTDSGVGVERWYYYISDNASLSAGESPVETITSESIDKQIPVPEGKYMHIFASDGTVSVYQRFGRVVIDSTKPVFYLPQELGDNVSVENAFRRTRSITEAKDSIQVKVVEDHLSYITVNGEKYTGEPTVSANGAYLYDIPMKKDEANNLTIVAYDEAGNSAQIEIAISYYYVINWVTGDASTVFTPNMGDELGAARAMMAQFDTDLTLPTVSRTGYNFLGWYTNSSYTGSAVETVAAKSAPIDADGKAYYYAKWEKATVGLSISAGVAQKLVAGTRYRITEKATFKVSGDSTVYQGNVDFYTATDGEFTFE